MARSIWVGFDPREADAFAVCCSSIRTRLTHDIDVSGVVLPHLQNSGLYKRPTEKRINSNGQLQLWDVRSDYWMSTEFAISRFFVPMKARGGYALFLDCDMLVNVDLVDLFRIAESDPKKAVWCVKHEHQSDGFKMDGQVQSSYPRKNWSSVMLFRVEHPSNQALTIDDLNTRPGRDLHRFYWLCDEEIGSLPLDYNYLVGHSPKLSRPKIVHFTDGVPSMPGYQNCEFADEWRNELYRWGIDPIPRV